VADRPVERELTPLALVLMPDEADADRDATPLFVEDSPDDSDI